jgi:hypothetical protein
MASLGHTLQEAEGIAVHLAPSNHASAAELPVSDQLEDTTAKEPLLQATPFHSSGMAA